MKKSIKILCSAFGLLSVSIPTIIAAISCSNGNETKPEKPVQPVEPITYDLVKDLKEEDFTDKNKTVLKIPDEYEKVDIFIGIDTNKKLFNATIDQLKLLENVVKIQLPKNIKYLNIDIPVSSNMSSLNPKKDELKELDGVMPKFNQLAWTRQDGTVVDDDPGDIHLKEFRLYGAATRLNKLIVPYADKYSVDIGPSYNFYYNLNNYVSNYETENPDFRLKEVDLSKCTNLIRTRNSCIRFYLCPELYSIKFNDTLTKIEPGFFNCSNWALTLLDIPKSVETMCLVNLEHTQVQFDSNSNLKELIYADDGCGNYNQSISKKTLKSNVKTLDLSHCQNYLSKNLVNFENWFAVNYKKYTSGYSITKDINDYDWTKFRFPDSYIDENDKVVKIDDCWKRKFINEVYKIKYNDK